MKQRRIKKIRAKSLLEDKKQQYMMYRTHSSKYFKEYVKMLLIYSLKYKKVTFLKVATTTVAIFFTIFWPIYYKLHPITVTVTKEKEVIVCPKTKTTEDFLSVLGFIESSGNYKAINQYGYLGKYQIGVKTLKQIGIVVPREVYLNNEHLQETAIKLLLKQNKEWLASYIGKYEGKTIGGIYITESGILGAAHLAPKGVIDFLKSNGRKVFTDKNGTPITKYLKELSGYDLKLE